MPEELDAALAAAGMYAEEHPDMRVVWFSDVARWYDHDSNYSSELPINWQYASDNLPRLQVLAWYMQISKRAWFHLNNAAERMTVFHDDGSSEVLTRNERYAVRQSFEQRIAADWPPYVRGMLASGRLTIS
jgi:hypothetical protein